MTDEQQRRQNDQDWLARAAAAENQRFLAELITVRSDRPAVAGGCDDQHQEAQGAEVSPESLADARAQNADFQQYVANYDPNLFRRGRRRRVEYDKPTGPKPETVTDAQRENAAFLRSLGNWKPD